MTKFLKAAILSAVYFFIYFALQVVFMIIFITILTVKNFPEGANVTVESMEPLINENIGLIIALSILVSFGIYYVIFHVKKRSLIREVRFKPLEGKAIFYILLLSLTGSVLISLLVSSLIPYFPSYNEVTESITSTTNNIFGVMVTTLMVPFFEEILFRGIIYREFKKIMPFIPALIIQALAFGIAHGNMLQTIYAFLLGLILGYVYHCFKSLWAPILLHCAFNLFGSLILPNFLYTNEILTYLYIIAGVFLTALCLMKLHKLGTVVRSSLNDEDYSVENSI